MALLDFLVCFQDLSYFMSPGDRSYDAYGLMRQLSEHTAAVVAEAHEILASGKSKEDVSLCKLEEGNSSKENSQTKEMVSHTLKPPNIKVIFPLFLVDISFMFMGDVLHLVFVYGTSFIFLYSKKLRWSMHVNMNFNKMFFMELLSVSKELQ